jgi:hypothetical protein
MKEFLLILEDTLKAYRNRLKIWHNVPSQRMEILKDMHQELKLLKETFEMLHPKDQADAPKWEEVIKALPA